MLIVKNPKQAASCCLGDLSGHLLTFIRDEEYVDQQLLLHVMLVITRGFGISSLIHTSSKTLVRAARSSGSL